MNVSLDNTEIAFACKSGKELKKARFVFKVMDYDWIVQVSTRIAPIALKLGLPVKNFIRDTIFRQFVGGETLEETTRIVSLLANYSVQVVLDYGAEGKQGEEAFEDATEEFLKTINYASTQKNIPFISIKITALCRFDLLKSLNDAPRLRSGIHDHEAEVEEWDRVRERVYRICSLAEEKNVGILIDAEESWIQDPIDRLSMEMMEEFNVERAVVYNTLQLYRHDRLHFLQLSHRIAQEKEFILGAKLVRGAYMEKERARATSKGYQSPVQPDKESTDRDFNNAILYCIDHIGDIAFIVASHNEESALLTINTMEKKGIPINHPHIHFSQLYGMSDNITFNLSKAGYSVSKYLPFGPIDEVFPYLMRRAQENSSVSGQSGRELALIKKELQRRGTK